eukprot:g2112.t1
MTAMRLLREIGISMSEIASTPRFNVLLPGHTHVRRVDVVQIDTQNKHVVTRERRPTPTLEAKPDNRGIQALSSGSIDDLVMPAVLTSSSSFGNLPSLGTSAPIQSSHDSVMQKARDERWSFDDFQKARAIAKRLVSSSAMKVLDYNESDAFELPSSEFHKARIACLRTCTTADFNIASLQEGQLVDAIDFQGNWYHATILRIIPDTVGATDNAPLGEPNAAPLVQLTYRVYHPSGKFVSEQDGERFTGFKRLHDEWHFGVADSIAAFGTKSTQSITEDMLSYESNMEAHYLLRFQNCSEVCSREEEDLASKTLEAKTRAEKLESLSSSTVPSAEEILAAAQAKRAAELAKEKAKEARKALSAAERAFAHYQASQRIELGGSSSTVCGSVEECQQQQDSSSKCPQDCMCFGCRIALATARSLQNNSICSETMASSSDERGARSAGNKGKKRDTGPGMEVDGQKRQKRRREAEDGNKRADKWARNAEVRGHQRLVCLEVDIRQPGVASDEPQGAGAPKHAKVYNHALLERFKVDLAVSIQAIHSSGGSQAAVGRDGT